jgi:hypothetical protein
MDLDLGDLTLHITATVGDPPPELRWRIGVVTDTTPADRAPRPATQRPMRPSTRKADLNMLLQADKKVTVSLQAHDEVGNPAEFDGAITFAGSDNTILAVTDHEDGTCEVAATGLLGTATVTVVATRDSDGKTFQGSLAFDVVTGDVESIELVASAPSEVTPDA